MEKLFKLKEHGTTPRTEVVAGFTTFLSMVYILAVNPSILADAGMDPGAVFTATAISATLATLCMAFFANYPVALASGMGLNAYFAYSVCVPMAQAGVTDPWTIALTAVLVEGIIFIILSLFKFRETLVNKVPANLKLGITVGIGLFITIVGLKGAGIVISDPSTLVNMGTVTSPQFALAIIGLIIIAILHHHKVPGSILWGILITWVLGMVAQLIGWYKVDVDAGAASLFSFLFVDIFDTVGTLIGVADKGKLLDKDGNLPRAGGALMADAVGTVVGACLGTSTVTSYVESSAGVAQGGRTGLTAVVVAGLFVVALFLSPIFLAIPGFATTPALVFVGLLMIGSVKKMTFDGDIADVIGGFMAIIMMPFTYSIANGIMFGIITWVILKLCTGKVRDIHPVMWVSFGLFMLRIITLALQAAGI